VVGIVIETVEVPGSRHLVSVIFTPKYLKNLEDQDEALFEMVARGDP
jgi:gamma-glutamyl-gamma-aminobutyrate hydrolase PuuD